MPDKKQVKLIILDVDGTLTDGYIHIASEGELFKSFYVRDGYAIKHMLPCVGILPAIITGRESKIVEQRALELGMKYIYQGVTEKDKAAFYLIQQLGLIWDQVAVIGDDLNDIPLFHLAGVTGCPADAVADVQEISDYICKSNGGHGAVREFIEWLLHTNRS